MDASARRGTAAGAGDADLVARCLRGEAEAERELFRRERARVHATLYRVLGSNRDMDDLLQETFLEVFRSLAGFRGEARLSTWIDRIAARVAYRWLEGRARRPPAMDLQLVPDPAVSTDGARRAHAREGVRRLYAALAEIGPAGRLAFALHAIDGRPLAEVAKLMGATVIATKLRVWRTRRELERRAAADPVLADFLADDAPTDPTEESP